MNTQGTGTSGDGLSFTRKAINPNDAPTLPVVTLTSFTAQEQAELKAIFKEALHEFLQEEAKHIS